MQWRPSWKGSSVHIVVVVFWPLLARFFYSSAIALMDCCGGERGRAFF